MINFTEKFQRLTFDAIQGPFRSDYSDADVNRLVLFHAINLELDRQEKTLKLSAAAAE